MLTRQRKKHSPKLPREVEAARQQLKRAGWSYRRAAGPLGVHYSHLCLVLTGKRASRSLIHRIATLTK